MLFFLSPKCGMWLKHHPELGRDGGEGWMRGENMGRGGDGGQGATTGYVVVPRSSRQRRGGRMAHVCLLLPTPSCSRNIIDGGQCESHTPPPFDSIYPPCGGCSFPASLTMTGAACNLHAAPFYFFFIPPCWGDALFHRRRGRRGGM